MPGLPQAENNLGKTDSQRRQVKSSRDFARAIAVSWKWTIRQLEAWYTVAQFILYGGAKGGGKTVFLCRWAVLKCAMFPGNKVFLGRKRLEDFKKTTLQTFLRYISPKLYRHNKAEKIFYLPWCNGEIHYGGLDDPETVDKFNSAEYGAVGIDQAEEITKDQLGSLTGTLRHTLPDGTHPDFQVLLTANPAECFLKYDFILYPPEGNKETGVGRYVFIKALHSDNPFLPESYVPNLTKALQHRPKLLKAYIGGIWDGLAAVDVLIQPEHIAESKRRRFTGNIIKRALYADVARQGDDETVIYILELSDTGMVRITHSPEKYIEAWTDNVVDRGTRIMTLAISLNCSIAGCDGVGLGAGTFDQLRKIKRARDENGEFCPDIYAFIAGEVDSMPDPQKKKYKNVKAWAYHENAKQFAAGMVCLPEDEVLCGQLLWQKTVLDGAELISRVLTKKELKEDHTQSPDRECAWHGAMHMLRISKPLPDTRRRSTKEEFWERVKADLKKSQESEEAYREI